MAKVLTIHPQNPQQRLVTQAAEMIRKGAVVAFPTDSCYALGCHLDDAAAIERIRKIRQLDKKHHFTLMCANLSELGTYAIVNNRSYRLLKANTPGAYTYILQASREVPKRLHHPKRKTIGLRVPENLILHVLLAELNEPLLSVTLILPNSEAPLGDADDIIQQLNAQVDLIIDGGHCGTEPTTVVDLEEVVPKILRVGRGDSGPFTL